MAKEIIKSILISAIGSPSSPTTPSAVGSLSSVPASASSGAIVKDSPLLLQQIADLKAALSSATTVRHYSVALDMQKKLASMRPLKVSSDEGERCFEWKLRAFKYVSNKTGANLG